jgi:hypothetical protein
LNDQTKQSRKYVSKVRSFAIVVAGQAAKVETFERCLLQFFNGNTFVPDLDATDSSWKRKMNYALRRAA